MAGGGEVNAVNALLFPFLCFVFGILSQYASSRWGKDLPYTAELFVIGTLIGVGVQYADTSDPSFFSESVRMWEKIDSHLLLAGFLPGLLFGDALHVNFHLFQRAFGQILIMAFPMVLLGTTLTALVGYYVFPYEWSFSFAMMFGSILAATDPVAVTALLNEVGAPPSLKTLIAGESQFNDGAAIVFFTIFSEMALFEYKIGLGRDYTVGQGFAVFFRMSLGGAAIGIAFGLVLVGMLYVLNRRLSREETVIQVTATIAAAYLSFFTAETVAHTSGVIAVVCCGIITKALGNIYINEPQVMNHVWLLIEHLLNTVLFVLAGLVWGSILADNTLRAGHFTGVDWGYLILLYVLVILIRALCYAIFFPVLSRIGFKMSWREATFITYGGLRGGVGIALAIAFDNGVTFNSSSTNQQREDSAKLFVMVGGISLFTLVINGSTSGFVLKKLGLVDATGARLEILRELDESINRHLLDDFVHLLANKRISATIDWSIITQHVPCFKDISLDQFEKAVQRNRESVPSKAYQPPDVSKVVAALSESYQNGAEPNEATSTMAIQDVSIETDVRPENEPAANDTRDNISAASPPALAKATVADEYSEKQDRALSPRRTPIRGELGHKLESMATSRRRVVTSGAQLKESSHLESGSQRDVLRTNELREIFIELLRKSYSAMISKGEVPARSFEAYALLQSLELEADKSATSQPLGDWTEIENLALGNLWTVEVDMWGEYILDPRNWCKNAMKLRQNVDFKRQKIEILVATAFIAAHQAAQRNFTETESDSISTEEQTIIEESNAQIAKAQHLLDNISTQVKSVVINHSICTILLYKQARVVESLVSSGVLKSGEGQIYLEAIAENIRLTKICTTYNHPWSEADTGNTESTLIPKT